VILPHCPNFHANEHDEKRVSENKPAPLHICRKDEKEFIFAIYKFIKYSYNDGILCMAYI
jgi:hypothetical protein